MEDKAVMTARLVGKHRDQRFYKLSALIQNGSSYSVKDVVDNCRQRLKPEYLDMANKGAVIGWDTICISDAHTHTERLVFMGCYSEKYQEYGRFGSLHLGGIHTMMTHGGSTEHVFPDEHYLQELADLNGYTWGGLHED